MKFVPKLLLSVLFSASTAVASAASYTELFVFGDSLSDPGNAYLLTGSNATLWINAGHPLDAQGHFSNGPTAAEILANALGVTPTKGWSVGGGNNFAVGGALSGAGNILGGAIAPLANTGISSQVAKFNSTFTASSTLFMVQGGANDFFQAFDYLQTHPLLSVAGQNALIGNLINTVSNNMADNVYQLGLKGATNILWTDMPDLGLTPTAAAGGAGFQAFASSLSTTFNSVLNAKILAVDSSLDAIIGGAGVNIFGVSESAFLQNANANPSSVYLACVAANGPNCSNSFFYDGVHPSTATHTAFAQQLIAAAVPEPETWAMLIVGLGLISLRARRKA